MPLAPNPMESFAMGQSIGKANSPVTGIGLAIQNVVDDARKRGLLKAEQDFKTQGAIEQATATLPAEFSKLKYASELDTSKAVNIAEGTAPIEVDKAVAIEEGTQPFKKANIITQAAAQGTQSRLTDQLKSARETDLASSVGQQPKPEIFRDLKTGKTMVRNYTFDNNSRQWVEKISPASFNLIEQITGGTNPIGDTAVKDPMNEKLDLIISNLFSEE